MVQLRSQDAKCLENDDYPGTEYTRPLYFNVKKSTAMRPQAVRRHFWRPLKLKRMGHTRRPQSLRRISRACRRREKGSALELQGSVTTRVCQSKHRKHAVSKSLVRSKCRPLRLRKIRTLRKSSFQRAMSGFVRAASDNACPCSIPASLTKVWLRSKTASLLCWRQQ